MTLKRMHIIITNEPLNGAVLSQYSAGKPYRVAAETTKAMSMGDGSHGTCTKEV